MSDFNPLEKSLGVKFKDQALLKQSLVHRSYINEHPEYTHEHNERLEFLGDAVIELVVTEYLYKTFPNPEGELTNWRASLVNAIMLSGVAKGLHIEEHLFLSKGEAKDVNTKARQYILANAIEAIIGALYLDQGYDVCKDFIMRTVIVHLEDILTNNLYKDPKSRFQEISQEELGITPSYRVISEKGPDHAKEFTVGIYLDKDKIAEGKGSSKQEAQVDAAANGLTAKGWK